ncbi:hypothetical protein CC85DRAFT_287798 [Cutaneotrichosporon oleaginosum]|uniref:SEC7 domain-containing protein n=1 Tax=Cutaneotrichosporon oleaginosum TaxID=879819 RepID=A0A0J0XGI7_9TREE|nr:uncharacterized protein CC85DRAFT_287798 [Cutaneotrichosporon oleaginosum]KLT40176.1 hypothetical protein CC85DRAFT_287798 [Cutaneotrichosporon oleaginosum]TXT06859.1 hypothetical protein COLE_06190 [Cutaneotrichosporon oleaginosum]
MVSTGSNGSNAPSTPTRKENRRRSWFGLVTPKRRERVSVMAPAPEHPEQPERPEYPEHPEDRGRMEELEPTPPVKRSGDAFPRQHSTTDDEESDSDREGTVRRKSKTRPKLLTEDGDHEHEQREQPVRMKDMATLAILSRNNTVKPKPFPSRVFQRTQSDSSSSSDALPAPAPRPHTLVLSPSRVPQRSSSVGARNTPTKQRFAGPPFDHSPPVNKPLPQPPHEGPSAGAPRAVSLPITTISAPPADIVVTPSSPIDSFEGLFGLGPSSPTLALMLDGAELPDPTDDRRPVSAPVSRTPSITRTPRAAGFDRPRPESPTPMRQGSLGLGLPESVAAKRASTPAGGLALRQQAVSSPLPERATSPVVKVTFSANEMAKPSQDKDRKPAKPRPRSLSAMFSRTPGPEQTPTPDDDETAPSGVLGWLGMQRAIKRRRSESKLRKRRSGFFSSENDAGPSENSTDDQVTNKTPMRGRFGANASTPMLLNRSVPDVSRVPLSAGSSLSSLPVIDQQEFWPAREWVGKRPSLEMETMSSETTTNTSHSDVKRDSAPVPVVSSSKDSVARRLLDPASQRSSMGSTSPLSSLPELGPPPTIVEHGGEATPPQVTPRAGGRGRSFSDAARRIHSEDGSMASTPRSLRSPSDIDLPRGPRPPMSSRSNSGNSAVMGMVRSVFSRNRPRSNSTLRYSSADERDPVATSEFGSRELPRPESSASSLGPSPALPPVRIRPEDVPQVSSLALQIGEDDRRVVLNDTPERSPRSSYAASQSSRTTHSTRRSNTADPHANLGVHSGLRVGRARAQTTSSAISWHGTFNSTAASLGHSANGIHRGSHDTGLAPPSAFSGSSTYLPAPSTPTFPTAATPPRQRPGSIRRLSTGLFRSNPSSPKPPPGQLFPLPPRGPGAGSSGGPSPGTDDGPSRAESPLPLSRSATPVQRLHMEDVDTSIHDDDTPESWLARLSNVDRRELAGILASSADEFHTTALTLYMNRFDFTHIALDVALRRLLMHMSLPKETQQIDRVIEAFATRYDRCEPGLFGTKDNAYVLAFSMMMLHTDAFNRHNKNKMTKPDYVRNTRLDGVPPPVLEAFFDNITFTPFVFIEDDNEAALAAAGAHLSASNGMPRSGKIDVYDLIVGGQLGSLRVDVERYIPADSPFSCMGTRPFLDVDRLQSKFANAHPLEFVKSRPRRKSAVPLLDIGGGPPTPTPKEEVTTLKITKVGLISRKDDSPTTKRTAARKWRSWSVILTGSQLLFFKDTIWALTLVEQIRNAGKGDAPVVPRMTSFQPDEVLSVKHAVAVFDRDYSATPFTFRFVMPDNRQYLMQFNDEYEMNEWLTLINYASTFRTAAIRMRGAGLNSGDAVKAGSVAAEEHLRDVESGTPYQAPESSQVRSVVFQDPNEQVEAVASPRPRLRRVGSMRSSPAPVVDISGANDVVVNGGEQMEAVIGSVKAELAAGRAGAARMLSLPSELAAESSNKTSRFEAIAARVQALKSDAAQIEQRLTTNLRIARNLAILTPFQKLTRDHIEAALPDLANQIRSDRIELSKLHLWITMLLKDQDRDQRDWARVRHVALQAAARSLCAPATEKPDRRATIAAPIAIPKLSLPDHDESASTWGESVGSFASGQASPGELPETNPMDEEHEHEHEHELEPEPPARTLAPVPAPVPQFPRIPEKTDVGSPQPSPTSNPTSDSDDYELAPEYLGSSESLRDEMERQLAFSDSSRPLSPVANPPSIPHGASVRKASEDGRSDQPEHWRNTRAATKVSLAHLPRSSIGELSRRFIKIDGNNNVVLNGD